MGRGGEGSQAAVPGDVLCVRHRAGVSSAASCHVYNYYCISRLGVEAACSAERHAAPWEGMVGWERGAAMAAWAVCYLAGFVSCTRVLYICGALRVESQWQRAVQS